MVLDLNLRLIRLTCTVGTDQLAITLRHVHIVAHILLTEIVIKVVSRRLCRNQIRLHHWPMPRASMHVGHRCHLAIHGLGREEVDRSERLFRLLGDISA